MKKIFSDEEITTLDNYFKDKIKKDIYVPETFVNDINQHITTDNRKNNFALKVAITCIITTLAFFSILSLPAINTFAENVPILKGIIQLFKIDAGVKNANEHGYLSARGISTEKNGYVLNIDNVTFDDERLIITATISNQNNPIAFDVDVDLPDFDNNRNISVNVSGDKERNVSLKIEKFFYKNELKNFLSKKQDFITLNVLQFCSKDNSTNSNVYNTNRYRLFNKDNDIALQEIKDIKIPINTSTITEPKNFKVNKLITLGNMQNYEVSFKVNSITINPTRMNLSYEPYENGKYILSDFENIILKDSDGHIYERVNNIITLERALAFVPSLYFDEIPEKLYLCFDGVYIYDKDNKKNVKTELKGEIPLDIKSN